MKTNQKNHARALNADEVSMGLRKPVKKLVRTLTPHETRLTLMLNTATHFTIRLMDQLKITSLYRQKLKLTGNAFLKELENHADEVLWVPGQIEDEESEQLEFLMSRLQELMMIALASTDVPDGLRPLYSVEMNRVFERFGMNVRFGPEGELRVVKEGKEVNYEPIT